MLCVNNAAENEWIENQTGPHFIYIGYTDMPPYGGGKGTKQYGWVTGCSSSYTKWLSGEPDNANNNQDYESLGDSSGVWYDWSPQDQMFCGCEYNPALTTTPSSRPITVPSSRPSTVPTFSPTASPSSHPTYNYSVIWTFNCSIISSYFLSYHFPFSCSVIRTYS
jgi:hypothetical protein